MRRCPGVALLAVLSFVFAVGCNDTGGAANDGGPTTCSGCAATEYCAAGTCTKKATSGPCADENGHQAAEVCLSGLCLNGACCTFACPASDSSCGATTCNAIGTCVYPGSTKTCGPAESCAAGAHTPLSSCDSKGGCAAATPEQCASKTCRGSVCAPTCNSASDCLASEFCSAGVCESKLAPGSTCAMSQTNQPAEACASGLCFDAVCCATACDKGDPACGATACSQKDGSCIYPGPHTYCGPAPACTNGASHLQGACGGDGGCVPAPSILCEPYACRLGSFGCATFCTISGGECAADAFCNSGACVLRKAAGAVCGPTPTSDANAACLSGLCSGHCCSASCTADPTTNNCQGLCDDTGACQAVTCPNNFGCSGTTVCNTRCAASSDCFAGDFCDRGGKTACCTPYKTGSTIYIDGVTGDDTSACCGTLAAPCQTITHAMKLIVASGTSGVILSAFNSDGSTGWGAPESWPIHLGMGVTLSAPNLYFANAKAASDIFDVYAYNATDTATVTIQGGSNQVQKDGVFIGFNPPLCNYPTYNCQGAYYNTHVGINDGVTGQTALPLVLSGVWLNSNDGSGNSYDLQVGAGAVVTLGPNPVEIGNGAFLGAQNGNLYGYHGIFCSGAGASIQDDPTATAPVLWVESRYTDFLDVEDGCSVSLTQGPQLGNQQISPSGWDGTEANCPLGSYCQTYCNFSPASTAVKVVGSGQVAFGSAKMPGSIHCAYYGIDQETSDTSGSPTVAVNGATIDLAYNYYCYYYYGGCFGYGYACAGAMVTEGTFSASATTFEHAHMGVFAGSKAVSVDLSGGGNGGNTFVCNNQSWGSQYNCGNNSGIVPSSGAGVVNATAKLGVNAENATWDNWDTTDNSTQVWSCKDTTYSSCTCTGQNCSSSTYPYDRAGAIDLSTNKAAIPLDSTVGAQSTTTSCQ